MPDEPDVRLKLTATQQELYRALADRRADVTVMYHAAVVIVNDTVVPDRLPLAAHAFRELMEKLPGDGVAVDAGADLNTKVNALRSHWDAAVAEDGAYVDPPTWSTGIGDALRTFLAAVWDFFRGRDAIASGRRQQAVEFLNQLDVAAVRLPEDVQRKNAREWMRLRRYFNDVSHHQFVPEEAEFQTCVAQLEAFLVARLVPRPTADFAEIDALLQEE